MCLYLKLYPAEDEVFIRVFFPSQLYRKVNERMIKPETKSVISSINLSAISVGHEINWYRLRTHLLFWQVVPSMRLLIGSH